MFSTSMRWAQLVGCLFAAGIAVWLIAPLALAACELADSPLQPLEPLEMNTVSINGFFKTVAMEKEVFICQDPTRNQIVDVETFIEIIEFLGSTVDRRVTVARCVKDLLLGTVSCGTNDLPLGFLENPLQGCSPSSNLIIDPVEMNTVNFRTKLPHPRQDDQSRKRSL